MDSLRGLEGTEGNQETPLILSETCIFQLWQITNSSKDQTEPLGHGHGVLQGSQNKLGCHPNK